MDTTGRGRAAYELSASGGVPWVLGSAVAGTTVIAGGAFWLSYTSLSDLARRSGVRSDLAWVWPLIVDGMIVVATISVVALSALPAGGTVGPAGGSTGQRHPVRAVGSRYAWALLAGGACVSVAGNVTHAALATEVVAVPVAIAALVACVPPLVLLAVTHLTVLLARHHRMVKTPAVSVAGLRDDALSVDRPVVASEQTSAPAPGAAALSRPPRESDTRARRTEIGGPGAARRSPERRGARPDQRREAARLRAEGMSDAQIALGLGVHRSTIGRWLREDSETGWDAEGPVVKTRDDGEGREVGKGSGRDDRGAPSHEPALRARVGWSEEEDATAEGTKRKDEHGHLLAVDDSAGA